MKILFVCKGNFFRSQVAEYYFKKQSKKHQVKSAGIEDRDYYGTPLKKLLKNDHSAAEFRDRLNMDLEGHVAKKITEKMIAEADIIVAILHDESAVPDYLKRTGKLKFWKVPDGVFKSGKLKSHSTHLKIVKKVRKHIDELVRELG